MEQNKEQNEKDKFIASINLIADKLTKINLSLDVLRTNINVSQFFFNELFRNINKSEKLDKKDKEKIIKTIEIYNSLNENETLNTINELSKKILLLKITEGEK